MNCPVPSENVHSPRLVAASSVQWPTALLRVSKMTPLLAVGEHRLKAAVLLSSGLFYWGQLPEADPFNFLPRFHVPTLMVAGRLDFLFPVETSLRPMFRLLGAPEKDKQLLLRDGGHVAPDGQLSIVRKETLDWFDRYLGPVK